MPLERKGKVAIPNSSETAFGAAPAQTKGCDNRKSCGLVRCLDVGFFFAFSQGALARSPRKEPSRALFSAAFLRSEIVYEIVSVRKQAVEARRIL